jgi:hypothetical protein
VTELVPKESSPLDTWNKLLENTLGGYPATQVVARAAKAAKEEPWAREFGELSAFIDRLWEVNP